MLSEENKLFLLKNSEPRVKTAHFCFICRMQSDGNKGGGKESEARVTGENSKRSPTKLAVVS